MHVKKNVHNNVIETLLIIKRKTNDGFKAHQYLVDMGILSKFHPQLVGWSQNQMYLKKNSVQDLCQTIHY